MDKSQVLSPSLMVGFIGGGNMAQSIIKGLLREGVLKPEQFYVSAPSDRNLNKIKELGIKVTHNNRDVATKCSILFLACKPYHMVAVMEEIYQDIRVDDSGQLVVPLSVGTTVELFEVRLPQGCPIIRVMPSLPSEVAAGIAMYTKSVHASAGHVSIVEALFKPLGCCEEVQEHLLDVTAQLGGAACAWNSIIIEALADGAVKMGLPRVLANKLAPYSLLGTAKLIIETGVHPAQIKDNVTSPAGTTICGVHIMEQRGVRGAMMDAIEGAVLRAREIAKDK